MERGASEEKKIFGKRWERGTPALFKVFSRLFLILFRFPEGFSESLINLHDGVTYTIVESTSTYFEAYKHVLEALQNVELSKFPFVDYLIQTEVC
jgi:hypothetical protein